MQELRDEYEERLARKGTKTDGNDMATGRAPCAPPSSSEESGDEARKRQSRALSSSRERPPERASFRATDSSASPRGRRATDGSYDRSQLKREVLEELRHELRAKSARDDTTSSEAESEEEVEDQVWLRAGQSATYPPQFLRLGECEEDLYNEKMLAGSVKVPMLPKDACGLHAWLRLLAAQVGPLDKSDDGALSKAILFYVRNGHRRSECAEDPKQGGLPRFSRHIAKAITCPEALATFPELAGEIDKHLSVAVEKGGPLLMGPILATIGRWCSYKHEAATGHIMLSFLQIRPSSLKTQDVAQFIRIYEQKLISTPAKRQPSGDVLF